MEVTDKTTLSDIKGRNNSLITTAKAKLLEIAQVPSKHVDDEFKRNIKK